MLTAKLHIFFEITAKSGDKCQKNALFGHLTVVFQTPIAFFGHLFLSFFLIFAKQINHEHIFSTMTEAYTEFLQIPLWVSLPLALVYVGLAGYIVYIIMLYHREFNDTR